MRKRITLRPPRNEGKNKGRRQRAANEAKDFESWETVSIAESAQVLSQDSLSA
jgi:hypothetical protein